ncbi:MAG: hypothetical protein GY943_19750 [Chloroflexi bacterium]|nr:hypothetical protein [Chloroflexota bacterium]
MMKTPFVWLGAKRAKKRDVGPDGALLDLAAKMGLPVPEGAILLHEFYQLLLNEGLIHIENSRIYADDPMEIYDALYTAVRFPHLNAPLILKPIYSSPATPQIKANNTPYPPVDWNDADQLSKSLCELWSLAQPQPVRLDILVMEQVDAELWGTAVTTSTNPTDDICYTNRSGEHTLTLAKLHGWKRPTAPIPPFAKRLQQLLRGVRRTIDHDHLEVHWADDGNICWLQQIIPVEQS